ncbi:MAG TPA: nitronate monooxygenase [Steroidobacteraceae bacterium]|nr:nitronate monooxygenase [Steroidobacteraceae bacterium]
MQSEQQQLPRIIQGGMGVAVSSWKLARAVAQRGQLGVVSGTGIDTVVARRLQCGDPGGHLRAAFDAFPIPEVAKRVWDRYFVSDGKPAADAYKSKPVPSIKMPSALLDLVVVSNFAEVYLAKAQHAGQVGLNLLEKVQLPNLASLFGAMLAKVDVVLMGAGIPRSIPAILDRFANGDPAEMKLDVAGAQPGEDFRTRFDPRRYLSAAVASLKRPDFFAIVSSSTLAMTLARKSSGKVNGFVVEGPTAGGHNAPPRGQMKLDANGAPVYGERDAADLEQIRALGLPFWLGGSYGSPEKFEQALATGAQGVQVGTAFAFCEESGLAPELKQTVIDASREGRLGVFTDPYASPTGFPFKVVQVPGTISDAGVNDARERVCDLAYLRQNYRTEDGGVGYRCPAEPLEDFLRKGGDEKDTHGRKCVCNGLVAAVEFGQVRRSGAIEPSLVTAGDDVSQVHRFLRPGRTSYTASDVIDRLLGNWMPAPAV